MDAPPSRRRCFAEEDDGLASLADMEAGFSSSHTHTHNHHAFFSRSLCLSSSFTRRASFRNLSVSSLRPVRFYDARFEEHRPHFLEACSLCKKPLGGNSDIFMYRGDTPFCSEECRQEQIENDEAKEKKLSLSSMKAMRNKDQRKSSSVSSSKSSGQRGYNFITRTVAAA